MVQAPRLRGSNEVKLMSEPLQGEQDRMEGTSLGDKSRRSFLWKSLATTALAVPGSIGLASKAARAAKPKPKPVPMPMPTLPQPLSRLECPELRRAARR